MKFKYIAYDKNSKLIKGEIEASSIDEAKELWEYPYSFEIPSVQSEDEKRFFKEFLNFLDIPNVKILKYDGKNNLKNSR